MTVANLLVLERASYLMTDSASQNRSGIVMSLEPKVIIAPRLRMAVAGNGETWDQKGIIIQSWLAMLPSADAAVCELWPLMEALKASYSAPYLVNGQPDPLELNVWPRHEFNLFFTFWSESRGRPEGYAVNSNRRPFYGCMLQRKMPGGVCEIRQHCSPPVEVNFDPAHAERDALAMMEVQRRYSNPDGVYTVGGTANLTIVNEAGVSTKELRRWPDVVGGRINPDVLSRDPLPRHRKGLYLGSFELRDRSDIGAPATAV